MMDKKFIEFIAKNLNIERQELVEKDLILHCILLELMKDTRFKEEFAFKGGTCLIKCYLGYYRFSEDLDFTYINQKEFEGKSESAIRKILSQKIDSLLIMLKDASDKYKLDFEGDKTNHHYVEYGGSNKFVTFKIWYVSAILNQRMFIKVQVNFVDKISYKIVEVKAKSIIKEDLAKKIKLLSGEYDLSDQHADIKAYSLNEILAEKVRAIITRKGIKARDFIDAYLIHKETKVNLKSINKEVVAKTIFMLKYEKYLNNIKNKAKELEEEFILGKEEYLLLKPLPEDFKKFVEESKPVLKEFIKTILKRRDA